MREITVTVPESTSEMTLGQMQALLDGNLPSAIGIQDADLLDIHLDDLQVALEKLGRVRFERRRFNGSVVIDGVTYRISDPRYMTMGEVVAIEEAVRLNDLATMLAIRLRPTLTRLEAVTSRKSLKEMFEDAMSPSSVVAFDPSDVVARADLFSARMDGATALGILLEVGGVSFSLL